MKQLYEIEARATAATEGPWHWDGEMWLLKTTGGTVVIPDVDHDFDSGEVQQCLVASVDAEFIAHARTDVPRLIAALKDVLRLANSYASDPERCMVADNAAEDIRRMVHLSLGHD